MLRFRRHAPLSRAFLIGVSVAASLSISLFGTQPVHAVQSSSPAVATINGAPDGFTNTLADLSELKNGARAYPTAASLRRAARRDIEAFDKALQSAGYYAATSRFELVPGNDGARPEVVFEITPGAAFEITEYEILYEDEAEGRPATFADANIKTTGAADGAALRGRQQAFLNHLWENGHPNAEIITRRAIANFETGKASAVFIFKSGPKARFGPVVVKGAGKTDEAFIARLRDWEIGEEYERSKLTSYYERLAETGLFASININPGETSADATTPIIVEMQERKRRTIGAGLSFSTAEGPGGRLFFEHRNILGKGENFAAEISGSRIEQEINLGLTKPLPRLAARAFANADFSNEITEAFEARSLTLSGGLSKKWLNDNLETRGAIALETSNVKPTGSNGGVEERNYFVSTPLSVIWNSEDDLLDPKKGFRAALNVTPYAGSDTFTQTDITARSRLLLGANDTVTLAARASLGGTFGSSLGNLPLNKRYYAGGGGSVRGFGFQEAGPLDAEGDPVGGRSRIEGAFEARVRVIKNVQLAGFVDAGSVSASSLPDFQDEFFIGYGAGFRYLTPIGPIRADVAFPLDPRDTDRGFQIYIALGQPF